MLKLIKCLARMEGESYKAVPEGRIQTAVDQQHVSYYEMSHTEKTTTAALHTLKIFSGFLLSWLWLYYYYVINLNNKKQCWHEDLTLFSKDSIMGVTRVAAAPSSLALLKDHINRTIRWAASQNIILSNPVCIRGQWSHVCLIVR